jgi:hypothetical protein
MADLDSRIIDDYFVPTKTRTIWEDFGDHTSGIQGIVLAARRVGVSWDAIRARTGSDLYAALDKTELPKTQRLTKGQLRDQLVVSTLLFKSMLTIRIVAAAIIELEALLKKYGATQSDISSTKAYLRTVEMRRRVLIGVRSVKTDPVRHSAALRRAEAADKAVTKLELNLPTIRQKSVCALAMLGADATVIAEAVGISRRSGDRARARWSDIRPADLGAWPVDHEFLGGWDTYRRELLDVAYARVRNDLPWAQQLIAEGKSSYRRFSATRSDLS